jgi:hypothetical protein
MKLSLPIIVALSCFVSVAGQELNLREQLLQSNGNQKVSKLFNEAPILQTDDLEAELYRSTFIPTFFNPIKIRVERHRGEYVLAAKRLSGRGGFEAGTLKDEKRRRLKPAEWNHLIGLLARANFWELPYAAKEPEPNEKGEVSTCLDGSEWVLEGVKSGRFHAVNRYCPDQKTFEDIGLYLAKLSGLRIKERELY